MIFEKLGPSRSEPLKNEGFLMDPGQAQFNENDFLAKILKKNPTNP